MPAKLGHEILVLLLRLSGDNSVLEHRLRVITVIHDRKASHGHTKGHKEHMMMMMMLMMLMAGGIRK